MHASIVNPQTCNTLSAYLLNQYPLLTAGRLHKYLRENKIKVNGKKVALTTRLSMGDEVKIFLPDDALFISDGPLYRNAKPILTVVYEDESLMIVDKPAGLLCIDENGAQADTLINRALRYLYHKGEYHDKGFAPALCHRLDTGTSGLVLIAKTSAMEATLNQLIKTRRIIKKYVCVTFGRPSAKSATLKGYLEKDAQNGRVYISQKTNANAKEVITQYETLAESGRLALLSVELITGRTHQIRAHLASIGCPILGDSKYGNNAANRELKLKYQALCAYSLQFPVLDDFPLSGKLIKAEKPWYFQQILNGILR